VDSLLLKTAKPGVAWFQEDKRFVKPMDLDPEGRDFNRSNSRINISALQCGLLPNRQNLGGANAGLLVQGKTLPEGGRV
jgi:hypothetical protein